MQDQTSFLYKHLKSIIIITTFINAWVASVSVLDDLHKRNILIAEWEPYVWEFSSRIVLLVLIYFVIKTERKHPLKYGNYAKHLFYHVLYSVMFSLIHVIGMVAIRTVIYYIMASNYDFGDWANEFIYEYRKDIVSYFFILSWIYVYQLITAQIKGDAKLVAEKSTGKKSLNKILIKKKGKEFIIDLSQVSTIESGGNYIYIHSNNQVYPMRTTMTKMQQNLDASQFVRVHRSYIVNLDYILEIQTPQAGEYRILLKNKETIPLSRTYRSEFLRIFK